MELRDWARGAAISATWAAVLACGGSQDYLDPALREQVEDLRAVVAAQPTTNANVVERGEVLWDWGNAFALQGGMLPVHFPTRFREVALRRFDGRELPEAALRDIDLYVREIALKESEPDALGRLTWLDAEPLVADSWVTLRLEYEVGSRPLGSGAVLLCGHQLMADHGELQNSDPAADHYVSLASSSGSARWEAITLPFSGMHGAFRGPPAPMPAFRLAEGELGSGETVTLTFGDRSGGSRGFRVQTHRADGMLLPVYVDLDGSGDLLSPRWPGLEVIGRPEVRGLRAFVPSIVAPDEPFELWVRGEDEYLNRPSGPLPQLEILLDGQPWRTLEEGGPALQSVTDVRLREPGIHRFTVRTADGSIRGSANPIRVEPNPGLRLYWGETHGHCGFAEGQGEAESFFRFGRDDSRLDFLTLSEHDAYMDAWEWQRLRELTREFHSPGEYVTFLGYEWSASAREGGHHNVLFRTPDRELVGVQDAPELSLLYPGLLAANDPEDVLVIPHAHNPGDWNRSDPSIERLVEVNSGHGVFEWFGNLYLRNGFEVGFIGASDDHRSMPGYGTPMRRPVRSQRAGIAAVWSPEKSADAIFDAMRSLSAYATTGERLILEGELNGHPMGTRQPQTDRREITARVAGTSPIDKIEVIKNGTVVFSQRYLAAPLAGRTWLQIGFDSSSEVFFPNRRPPRWFRVWDGTLQVEGARVVSLRTTGLDNHYADRARISEEDPQRIDFHIGTRGRMDTILVELDRATASTRLRFDVDPAAEQPSTARGWAPALEDLPEAAFEIALADLEDGRIERGFRIGEHVDRVVVQVVDPEAPMDRELRYTDLEDTESGDYYYLRVGQLDGGMAFSSPFWVGERSRSETDTTRSRGE